MKEIVCHSTPKYLQKSLVWYNSVTTQNCDFSGKTFKGFEVL